MARFLDILNGVLTQINPISTSVGVGDANKIPQTSASGKLDMTLMPAEITAQAKTYPASEDLTAGDLVNIWVDSGTTKVRKASGTSSRVAVAYTNSGVVTGATSTVYTEGFNTNLSGLTPGGLCWLGAAGAVTQTPPVSGSGGVSQIVGTALSATEMEFEPNDPVTLASA